MAAMHCLVDLDVTTARGVIARSGDRALSFTAFVAASVARAAAQDPQVHAYRDWRGRAVMHHRVDVTARVGTRGEEPDAAWFVVRRIVFLPVIGYADDAIIVAFVVRSVVRRAGLDAVRAQWPGSEDRFAALVRLTGLHLSSPAAVPPPACGRSRAVVLVVAPPATISPGL